MKRSGDLERRVADLSQHLLAEEAIEVALQRVATLAVGVLPSCDACGVSLVVEGRVATRVATDPMADRVDLHQYTLGEGPCLEAIRTGTALRVDSLAEEARWPRFVPRAVEEGVVSSYSVPLQVQGRTVGALNLYSRSATFGPEDESAAAVFVSQAAVALANAQIYERVRDVIDQLNEALATRDVIGQAKGIVMARERCSADAAFDVLRSMSQSRHRKLNDVAQQVIDSATKNNAGS
jgi:GAF domain-containing protein